MKTIELGVFGCPPDANVTADYAALGFSRCVVSVPPTGDLGEALRARSGCSTRSPVG